MSEDRSQDQWRAHLRHLATERDRIDRELPEAIAGAMRAGVRQSEVAADVGRTREYIRRIARGAGLGPAR